MAEKLLRLDKLATKYIGGDFLLTGAEFDLKEEEFLFVYGREASGKTLLLRTIAGLEAPSSGTIYLDGKDLKDIASKDREIGYTFDSNSLNEKESVEEAIAYPMKLRDYPIGEISERISEVCELFKLERVKRAGELSSFETAKLLLARLFATRRKLYLVDDVWKDLSIEDKREIYGMLTTAARGKRVIAATDDADFVRSCRYGDAVVLFDGICSQKSSLDQMKLRPPNIECAILCGFEIYMDVLGKDEESYFTVIDGLKYSVAPPLSDVYVGKEVCFAITEGRCACYYDKNCERIISQSRQ